MCSTLHFYRPLNAIGAFTFDLDDTLYDNHPVIIRTERESLAFCSKTLNRCAIGKAPIGNACEPNYGLKILKFTTTSPLGAGRLCIWR